MYKTALQSQSVTIKKALKQASPCRKWVISSMALLIEEDSQHQTQFVVLVPVEKAEGLKI